MLLRSHFRSPNLSDKDIKIGLCCAADECVLCWAGRGEGKPMEGISTGPLIVVNFLSE